MRNQLIINLKILTNMKKFTLAIAAVMIAFVMTSCGGESPKEKITKATDEFFTKAEQELQNITNGEDFMAHFYQFEDDKQAFLQNVLADYLDKDGNIKGISESEGAEIEKYISERATAYNQAESKKAYEFMEPVVAKYEAVINSIYEAIEAGQPIEGLADDFEAIESELANYADFDNVPTELQQRAQAAEAKLNEVLAGLQ